MVSHKIFSVSNPFSCFRMIQNVVLSTELLFPLSMEHVLQKLIACFLELSENNDKDWRRKQSLKSAQFLELRNPFTRLARQFSSLHLYIIRARILDSFSFFVGILHFNWRERAKSSGKFVTRRRSPFEAAASAFSARREKWRRCASASSDWCFDAHWKTSN